MSRLGFNGLIRGSRRVNWPRLNCFCRCRPALNRFNLNLDGLNRSSLERLSLNRLGLSRLNFDWFGLFRPDLNRLEWD